MTDVPDDDRRTWRIVLAEDQAFDRAEAKAALLRGSTRRYAFAECETAAEAIAAVTEGGADCLILDYQLPDADAPEVLARLPRAADAPDLPAVPVVVVTGADAGPAGAERNRTVLRAGAQDFVGKDWMTPASLTRAVEAAVERHRTSRALEARDRALRISEARLRLTLDGAGISWWEWDFATDAVVCDERTAQLWGGTVEEFAHVDAYFARVHPDDRPGLRTAVSEAIVAGGSYAAEFRVVLPGQQIRWLVGRGRVLPEAGAAGRLHGINFDVTERREQEEALRQANAEMERFTYTVSHDLKSPLVTVTGFLGLLKTHVAAGRGDKAVDAAERALAAAERMSRLIDDLLVLSRAGRVASTAAPVSLDAVADRLAGDLRARTEAAGGRIEIQHPLGTVLADTARIEEALENLLVNAVHYGLGSGGTRIVVRTERGPTGACHLIVEDDGTGVPAAYRDRVFELFQRLDTGTAGTGVGLAVVARVMEVVGGRAYVEGAGGPPGREGARFVLAFPPHTVVSARESSDDAATDGAADAPRADASGPNGVEPNDSSHL